MDVNKIDEEKLSHLYCKLNMMNNVYREMLIFLDLRQKLNTRLESEVTQDIELSLDGTDLIKI